MPKGLLIVVLILAGILVVAITFAFTTREWSWNYRELVPNKYVEGAQNLKINVSGLRVTFDPSTDTIYLPDELKIERFGNSLSISRPFTFWFAPTTIMIVGTKREFSDVELNTGGISAYGTLKTRLLTVNSAGVDANLTVDASDISVNGAGITLKGTVDTNSLSLNGAGLKVDIDVKNLDNFTMNGAGLDGRVKYLDRWTGTRNFSINAVGGNFDVYIPSGNEGNLNIKRGGIVSGKTVNY